VSTAVPSPAAEIVVDLRFVSTSAADLSAKKVVVDLRFASISAEGPSARNVRGQASVSINTNDGNVSNVGIIGEYLNAHIVGMRGPVKPALLWQPCSP
jgi:hypothetical protein